MTTTNRLAKPAAPEKPQLTAADNAAIAEHEGKRHLAEQWREEARNRGEPLHPLGVVPRFNSTGGIDHVDTARKSPSPRKHIMNRDRSNFTHADWQELNAHLEQLGSSVRYGADGSRYSVAA